MVSPSTVYRDLRGEVDIRLETDGTGRYRSVALDLIDHIPHVIDLFLGFLYTITKEVCLFLNLSLIHI